MSIKTVTTFGNASKYSSEKKHLLKWAKINGLTRDTTIFVYDGYEANDLGEYEYERAIEAIGKEGEADSANFDDEWIYIKVGEIGGHKFIWMCDACAIVYSTGPLFIEEDVSDCSIKYAMNRKYGKEGAEIEALANKVFNEKSIRKWEQKLFGSVLLDASGEISKKDCFCSSYVIKVGLLPKEAIKIEVD